jgi:hypothetical protein
LPEKQFEELACSADIIPDVKPPSRAKRWNSGIVRNVLKIVKPAQILVPTASFAPSASFGSFVEKVKKDIGLSRRQKAINASGSSVFLPS